MEESTLPTLKGGSGGDGFFRLMRPGYQKPKRKQTRFGTKKSKTPGELSSEEQNPEGERLAFVLCVIAPEELPAMHG